MRTKGEDHEIGDDDVKIFHPVMLNVENFGNLKFGQFGISRT